MKYLLDTHTLLWALNDDPKLPLSVREILIDQNNTIYVSVCSIWEIAIKNKLGKLEDNAKTVVNLCTRAGVIFLSVGYESVCNLYNLNISDNDRITKDPFDNMLVAQSKTNNLILLTHDSKMSYFKEPTVQVY